MIKQLRNFFLQSSALKMDCSKRSRENYQIMAVISSRSTLLAVSKNNKLNDVKLINCKTE